MKKNKVDKNLDAQNASWTFEGNVSKSFSDHVEKSVPFYKEGHELICYLSDYFVHDDSIIYELGSSTGKLICQIEKRHKNKQNISLYGLDVIQEMSNQAKIENPDSKVNFLCEDIEDYNYEKSDLMIMYYTLQFIKPRTRQTLVNNLYKNLNWGGALLLFEKTRAPDARFQDIVTGVYNEFKIEQGFESEEIFNKTRSLKGVLEPFSHNGNVDILKRAGFVDILPIFRYIPFEGFLAIK